MSVNRSHKCCGGFFWRSYSEDTPDPVSAQPIFFEVNADYSTQGMEARKLTAVVNSWGAGAISEDTLLELLRKGEIPLDDRSNEEEEKLLQQAALRASECPVHLHLQQPMKHLSLLCKASRSVVGSFDAPGLGGRWDPNHCSGYRFHIHQSGQLALPAIIQDRLKVEL